MIRKPVGMLLMSDSTTKDSFAVLISKANALVRKGFLLLGFFVLASYLALLAVLYSPLYTSVVLHPDRGLDELYNTAKLLDVPREEVFFDSSGTKLHGWLFRKPGSDAVVVIHHGNGGTLVGRLLVATKCLEAGTSVFLYDYAGYGKSDGTSSVSGILNDGLAAFDYAREKFKFPIIINYGESIGSGVACHVDANRSASALILQSAIASLPAMGKEKVSILKIYPDVVWPQPQLDNKQLLARSKTPLLLIHGALDSLVPFGHSRLLLDSSASADKQLVTLPSCGHNDVGYNDPALFQETIAKFVARHRSTAHGQ